MTERQEGLTTPPAPVQTTAKLKMRREPGGAEVLAVIEEGAVIGLDGLIEVEVNGVIWAPVTFWGWVAKQYLGQVQAG